jgi:hypothetical protein
MYAVAAEAADLLDPVGVSLLLLLAAVLADLLLKPLISMRVLTLS